MLLGYSYYDGCHVRYTFSFPKIIMVKNPKESKETTSHEEQIEIRGMPCPYCNKKILLK